jgi:multisubunit Na+/H+ antiporter MnhB subunit
MNFAHLHLVLNHVPVIGIPVALTFLVYGIFAKNQPSQRFALLVLIVLAAVVLPVYFTGEPAENVIEHLPGVAESFIDAHESAAMFSLVLTLSTGAAALLALWFRNDLKKNRLLNFAVLGVASFAVLSLLYTANLGGKVRHTELRSDSSAQIGGEFKGE